MQTVWKLLTVRARQMHGWVGGWTQHRFPRLNPSTPLWSEEPPAHKHISMGLLFSPPGQSHSLVFSFVVYFVSDSDQIIFLLILHYFDQVIEFIEPFCDCWTVSFTSPILLLKTSHNMAPGFILAVKIYLLIDWYIWVERFCRYCITKWAVYILSCVF